MKSQTLKITHTITNYSLFNIVGQLADWGSKPGRIVSISYVCEDGYVALKNCRDPHQFTTDYFKNGKCVTPLFRAGSKSIDWESKKSSVKTNRCIDGLKRV